MTHIEYFKWALKNTLYKYRDWHLVCFGLPFGEAEVKDGYPYVQDDKWFVKIEGVETDLGKPFNDSPLLTPEDKLDIDKEVLINVSEKIKTSVGNCVFNAVVLVNSFGDRIPFINQKVNGKLLDGIIAKALRDKLITPKEFTRKFTVGMGLLTVYTQLIIPAATLKSLQSPPGIEKIRDDFIAKNKDRMHTPSAAAELDTLLTDILREHLKDDPSMKHLLKPKAFATVRKMLYGSIGGSTALDDLSKVIYTSRSLKEGWRPEDLYGINNGLRTGSSLRGIETQQGGYTAKKNSRAYQDDNVAEEDCGTTIGMRFTLRSSNYQNYVGRYLVGSDKPLGIMELKALVGKPIIMRDVNACKTAGKGYCVRCFGDNVGKSGIGIGSQMSALGSQFLSISLSLFHANELKLEEFVPKNHFF